MRLMIPSAMDSIEALAVALRESLDRGESDGVRLRLVRQFLMDSEGVDVAIRIAGEPSRTGSEQWDALLAGIAEHIAFHAGIRVPSWTAAPSRFLSTWWFLMPYPALHGIALAESPPALANRGVFIRRASLVNV